MLFIGVEFKKLKKKLEQNLVSNCLLVENIKYEKSFAKSRIKKLGKMRKFL